MTAKEFFAAIPAFFVKLWSNPIGKKVIIAVLCIVVGGGALFGAWSSGCRFQYKKTKEVKEELKDAKDELAKVQKDCAKVQKEKEEAIKALEALDKKKKKK